MNKQIVRLSGRTFISWISLMAVVCVPSFIAGANYRQNDADSSKCKAVQMRVTAYCPCSKCCGKYTDGVTASGHKIQPGDMFVAADEKYPFGTEIIVPGYNNGRPVKVLDRGGAIKGNRIDVFFHSHQEALEWGVKYLDVQVSNK